MTKAGGFRFTTVYFRQFHGARILREHSGVVCLRSRNDDDNPAINRVNTELGYRPWIDRTNWHADVAAMREYLCHRE